MLKQHQELFHSIIFGSNPITEKKVLPPHFICNECRGDLSTGSCNCSNGEFNFENLRCKTQKTPDYDDVLDPRTKYNNF